MTSKKFALGLYEKGLPNHLSLLSKLEIAQKVGFDFLELSIDESDEKINRLTMSKQQRLEIHEYCIQNDFPIGTICLSANRRYPIGDLDPKTSKLGVQMIKDTIDLSCDLGVRLILLSGYDVFYSSSTLTTRENFKRQLINIVEYASLKGVPLAIETMDTEFINCCKKAMAFIDEIKSPYLGIYLDTGNITSASLNEEFDILKDIEIGKDKIMCVHLKDAHKNEIRHVEYGSGVVNFDRIVEYLHNIKVNRFVLEFWSDNTDWKTQVETSHMFGTRLLEKYFKN